MEKVTTERWGQKATFDGFRRYSLCGNEWEIRGNEKTWGRPIGSAFPAKYEGFHSHGGTSPVIILISAWDFPF